jgi:hypothetical protein
MKRILLLMLLAASVTPVLAQQTTAAKDIDTEPDFIFIQEINWWKALQNHDLAAFHAMLMPDFLDIEKTIQTREQIMESLNTCALVSFKIRNHQLRMLSPDAAVVTYSRSSETACGESHLTGDYIHAETPAAKP